MTSNHCRHTAEKPCEYFEESNEPNFIQCKHGFGKLDCETAWDATVAPYCSHPIELDQRAWLPYPENAPEHDAEYEVTVKLLDGRVQRWVRYWSSDGGPEGAGWSNGAHPYVIAFRPLPAPWDGIKREVK